MELAGEEVPIIWRGRRARAFVPTRLAERPLPLAADTVARAARAELALERAAEAMPHEIDALARLLLRTEGVASSFIEGVTAPLVDVVIAEEHRSMVGSPASWVANNLAAAVAAASDAHTSPLSVEQLCNWHRALMAGSPTPARYIGCLHTEQGWIGGTSPLDAHLVTPPPEALLDLINDLVAYANRTDVDAVTQAAVAHAQFEIIHPFADGNGRIGRVLISWILTRRLALVTPPPVSARIAADIGGYSSGLVLFRMGDHNAWIRSFADVVAAAGRVQHDLVSAVEVLQRGWREQLAAPRAGQRRMRGDAAAWRVVELLPRHLLLTAPLIAELLEIPRKSAAAALRQLSLAGVLVEWGTLPGEGRPSRLYVSPEVLGLVGASSAHPSGRNLGGYAD